MRESPTVETIPEEDETALEQSWSARTGREEEKEDGQKMSKSGERENAAGEKPVVVQEQGGETSGANEEVISLEQKADGDKAPDGPNE